MLNAKAKTTTTRVTRDLSDTVWSYVRLTKPRIVMLLVITTIPAMIMAEGGLPSLWLVLATVLGGSVVAGGANAMNMYFDRDIDELMRRTRSRPVPAGEVEPEKAAAFGMVVGATGVAMPPVIGWAAVTGEISVAAIIMFAIVTAWTPPHFWALSINYSADYARAGVPMLPVVAGAEETKRQILLYAVGLVVVSVLLSVVGGAGLLYLGAAAVLGALFLYYAVRLWRDGSARSSAALYRY